MLSVAKTPDLKLQLYGIGLVTLSGILYGLIGFLGTKLFQENFSVVAMLFWRFLIASLWMLIPNIIRKQFHPKNNSANMPIKMITLVTLFYAISSALFFIATKYIATGPAMTIFFSFPVFVAIFFWKSNGWQIDKITLSSILFLLIGLMMLIQHNGKVLSLVGVMIAFCAAFFYACYVYHSQRSRQFTNTKLLTLFICMGCTLVFLFLATLSHTLYMPQTYKAWFYICTIGIIATALPIQLMLDGLQYVSSLKASILSIMEPIVTVLLGVLCLNENLSALQVLGIATMILGAILIQFEA